MTLRISTIFVPFARHFLPFSLIFIHDTSLLVYFTTEIPFTYLTFSILYGNKRNVICNLTNKVIEGFRGNKFGIVLIWRWG